MAEVGSSAALIGLIVVAITIGLDRTLVDHPLDSTAEDTFAGRSPSDVILRNWRNPNVNRATRTRIVLTQTATATFLVTGIWLVLTRRFMLGCGRAMLSFAVVRTSFWVLLIETQRQLAPLQKLRRHVHQYPRDSNTHGTPLRVTITCTPQHVNICRVRRGPQIQDLICPTDHAIV